MKHAILLTVHDNEQVNQSLIRILCDSRFHFYLLLDRKSDKSYSDFIPKGGFEKFVTCLPQIDINWAGFSQIEAMLNLMEAALKDEFKPDWLHFLQGADLPLKTPDEIDCFFSTHDYEYINFQPQNFEFAKYKVLCKHYFTNNPGFRSNKILKIMDHGIAHLQKPFIDRKCQLYHGSALCTVSRMFANELVNNRDTFRRIYYHSLAADEVFIQTYIMNSRYKSRLSETFSNARLIDWDRREGNSPRTFTMEDKELLLQAMDKEGVCFARKFLYSRDADVVSFVEEELMRRKQEEDV